MGIITIVFLLIPFFLLLSALTFFYVFLFGPPFVPTPQKTITKLVEFANISKKDVVIDLGSGDGRMLIASAKQGAQTRGWELNPILVLWTNFVAKRQGVGNRVKVYQKNYMNADVTDATVIFLYTFIKPMALLEKKLTKELKKGSKIISYKFTFPNLKPIKHPEPDIYIYEI